MFNNNFNKWNDLPLKLKKLRKNNNLTQTELSELLFINQSTYANWEAGRRTPGIHHLIKLSELYDITLDKLLK